MEIARTGGSTPARRADTVNLTNSSVPVRQEGKITSWRDDKGFGFITPSGGGESVFLHIKAFSDRAKRPTGGEVVTYERVIDEKNRVRAAKVAFAHQRSPSRPAGRAGTMKPSAPPDRIAMPLLIASGFVAGLLALAILRKVHFIAPLAYILMSVAAFLAYADDKSRAERMGSWRISEGTLHAIALLCGWPGAWIAQRLFRHKSKKQSFQQVFWGTVAFNCVALALFTIPDFREWIILHLPQPGRR